MIKIILWTLVNLAGMTAWGWLAFRFVDWFGLFFGIILYALAMTVWDNALTLIRAYLNKEDALSIAQVIYSTNWHLPFTAYGCYCSPAYGMDGRTKDLEPIDGLDAACFLHDKDMLYATGQLTLGNLERDEYVSLKNRGDLKFMFRAITSGNTASGAYLLLLEIGFLFRLIARTITKR